MQRSVAKYPLIILEFRPTTVVFPTIPRICCQTIRRCSRGFRRYLRTQKMSIPPNGLFFVKIFRKLMPKLQAIPDNCRKSIVIGSIGSIGVIGSSQRSQGDECCGLFRVRAPPSPRQMVRGLLSHGTVQRSQDLAGRIYSHDNNGRNRPQQQRPQQVTKPAAQKPCLRRRYAIVTAAVGPEFLIDDKE